MTPTDGHEADVRCHDRTGLATLVRAAMEGGDMLQVRDDLLRSDNDHGAAMDLAVVEQLLGNRARGLEIQAAALQHARCFRSRGYPLAPRLRVLALAAPVDIGANTPIEFLIRDETIELKTLYFVPGLPADLIPDHDVAIVTMSDEEVSTASLDQIKTLAATWPKPMLNRPDRVGNTDRDRLYSLIHTVPALKINPTVRIERDKLEAIGGGRETFVGDIAFPIIARPVGSHAGHGLQRLVGPGDVEPYLAFQLSSEFFISPYTDYSSPDGLFRKYRVVFVDGQPYACHMAISEQWAIWYLNAEMEASEAKRLEEAHFMAHFGAAFGLRHAAALADVALRLGLDYFVIDCAETKDGKLLVFEAGVTMIVHDLDQAEMFAYKPPQMRKVFAAFTAMLDRKAAERQ
ncbi:RimK family alpha-L-glutamate ligase [Beijerinckia sp. L45]|uniref:ATP-grasp domain-containing protein n=1 Tax=Beijerinckia sp. L45 TaxID=1641855 RepID=UPI00131C4FDC|nr:hypothetical protein [Beijerinckia sp. L45]